MSSTQYSKRKIEDVDPSNSDGDYAHLTPLSSTHFTPHNPEETGECKTRSRPRRAGVNYERKPQDRASTFPQVRKGRKRRKDTLVLGEEQLQREPLQLPPNEPSRSTSSILFPSETTRPTTLAPSSALPESAEVRELLSGQARSNDLVINNPIGSTLTSNVSAITLGLAVSTMSYLSSPFGAVQKKAGDVLAHWRTAPDVGGQMLDNNHDEPNTTQTTQSSTTITHAQMRTRRAATPNDSITYPKNLVSNNMPLDSPTSDDEISQASYVKCNVNEHSEVSFEEVDTPSDMTSSDEGKNAPTPPPPPQHGYPGPAEEYRENVPMVNAPRWDGSAIVWDNHDLPYSSRVLFDSGSKPNFISSSLAKRLGFQPLLLQKEKWELFSTLHGRQDIADHYIKLDIEMRWLNFSRKKQFLLVVETDEIDIILGEYFMGENGITEKLVANAQASTASRSFAIITSKPTPEQIRRVLEDKERRKSRALKANANIEEDRRSRQGQGTPSRQDTSHSSAGITAASAREGVYGPQMATALNNSFDPAMGRDQNARMPGQRQAPTTYSSGRSSADNSSLRDSLESSPTNSTHLSPATTFSSLGSTGSAKSSFDRMKQKIVGPLKDKRGAAEKR